jgi:hypothetical protein
VHELVFSKVNLLQPVEALKFLTMDIVHHYGYVLPEGEVIFIYKIARMYQ